MAKLTVILKNDKHEIQCDEGDTILDACLKAGLAAPYSCLEGVCTACMAVKLSGEIEMREDTALDPGEVIQGRILTCQAKVTSDQAKITYEID